MKPIPTTRPLLIVVFILAVLLALALFATLDTGAQTSPTYTFVSGRAVMEAENYHGSRGTWQEIADTAAAGDAAMENLPHGSGIWAGATDAQSYAPYLKFRVLFPASATYYFHARVIGANGSEDTIHFGVDGVINAATANIGCAFTSWGWCRASRDTGSPANMFVSAGWREVYVYAREDGVLVDKIIVSTSSTYIPSGKGSAETALVTATPTPTPTTAPGGDTATPTNTPTTTPTRTPTTVPSSTPTKTPTPTRTPTPTPTNTPIPGATSTPTATKTPTPTHTATSTTVIGLDCNNRSVTIAGTAGDDTINGTSGPDVIHGLGGNDAINGNGGDDTICGGDGDDILHGNGGMDQLFGGAGADTLDGDSGADVLWGEDGNDTIIGDLDIDACHGGTGTNKYTGCELADEIDSPLTKTPTAVTSATATPTETTVPTLTPTPTHTNTATTVPGSTNTPTATTGPTATTTPRSIGTIPSGVMPAYNWDYAGLSESWTEYTSQGFVWRDIQPEQGGYDWSEVERWINNVVAYGKKPVIRFALRCEDVPKNSDRWNGAEPYGTPQRGDICTPPWLLADLYNPIIESTTGLAASCLEIAGNPIKRLNWLDSDVTAAIQEFMTAVANRYKNDVRVAGVQWGTGYQYESKPGARTTAACDYSAQQAAYVAEYGTLRPQYNYLRVASRDEVDQGTASRQWLWYMDWLFNRLREAYAGSSMPVYVFTGSAFVDLYENGPATRKATENGLLNWQAGAEKGYFSGSSASFTVGSTTYPQICAWAEARRPEFGTGWKATGDRIFRSAWLAIEQFARIEDRTSYSVEQSQVYDRSTYRRNPNCLADASSQLCVNAHQKWTTLNILDKGANTYEPFHNDIGRGGAALTSFWAQYGPWFGSTPAERRGGWVVLRSYDPVLFNYCADPYDYSFGIRAEQEQLRMNYSANPDTQTAYLSSYQTVVQIFDDRSKTTGFVGPSTDVVNSWRGEGGRRLYNGSSPLNFDVDDDWILGETVTGTISVTYLDGALGNSFRVVYDSTTGAKTALIVETDGTNVWRTESATVTDIRFANSLPVVHPLSPHGYDLALEWLTGGETVISELRLSNVQIVGQPTPTPTATATTGATPTHTPTATPSRTPTRGPTSTPTNTQAPTQTPVPTNTRIPGATDTPTITPSATPTTGPTPTPRASVTTTATRTPTRTATPYPVAANIYINEVAFGFEDSNGNGIVEPYEDQCVEILNRSGDPQDLDGWTLYNNDRLLYEFEPGDFEDGTLTAVFGVWWDDWRLQPGTVTLYDANDSLLASVTFTAAVADQVYARQPDGGPWAEVHWPTCGYANDSATPTATPRATVTIQPTYTPTRTATPTRTVTPTRTATPRRGTATATPTKTPLP